VRRRRRSSARPCSSRPAGRRGDPGVLRPPRQARAYLVVCFAFAIPGLLGVGALSSLWPLIAASLVLGFFLVPALRSHAVCGGGHLADAGGTSTAHPAVRAGRRGVRLRDVGAALGGRLLHGVAAARLGLLLVAASSPRVCARPPPASGADRRAGEEGRFRSVPSAAAGSAADPAAPDAPRPPRSGRLTGVIVASVPRVHLSTPGPDAPIGRRPRPRWSAPTARLSMVAPRGGPALGSAGRRGLRDRRARLPRARVLRLRAPGVDRVDHRPGGGDPAAILALSASSTLVCRGPACLTDARLRRDRSGDRGVHVRGCASRDQRLRALRPAPAAAGAVLVVLGVWLAWTSRKRGGPLCGRAAPRAHRVVRCSWCTGSSFR